MHLIKIRTINIYWVKSNEIQKINNKLIYYILIVSKNQYKIIIDYTKIIVKINCVISNIINLKKRKTKNFQLKLKVENKRFFNIVS